MRTWLLLSLGLLLAVPAFAGVNNITEEDGSPSLYPWQIKFSNGTVTDNGSGSVTVTTTGGTPGSGVPGSPDKSYQYNNGGLFAGDSAFTFDTTTSTATATSLISNIFTVGTTTGTRFTSTGGVLTMTEQNGGGTKNELTIDTESSSNVTFRSNTRNALLWRGAGGATTLTSFSLLNSAFIDASSSLTTGSVNFRLIPEGTNGWQIQAGSSAHAGANYLAINSSTLGAHVVEIDKTTGNWDFKNGSITTLGPVSAGDATFSSIATNTEVIGGTSLSNSDITFSSNGASVFNEQSNDADTRMESDGNANMFFLDAGFDAIGIGTSTVSVVGVALANLVVGDATTNKRAIFAQSASSDIFYGTSGSNIVNFQTALNVFNDAGGDIDFKVKGDTNPSLFIVDAGLDEVQIAKANIDAGTIDGTTIGASSASSATFTSLNASGGGALTGTWSDMGTVTTIDINGGTIDGTKIGASSAADATFTNVNLAVGNKIQWGTPTAGIQMYASDGFAQLYSPTQTYNYWQFQTSSTGSSGTNDGLTVGYNTQAYVFNRENTPLSFGTGGVIYQDITTTSVVFNENSANYDFRAESDNDANMFFLDASADSIGIRNATPTYTFDVTGSIRASTSLTSPIVATAGALVTGGTIDGTKIGSSSSADATFTNVKVIGSAAPLQTFQSTGSVSYMQVYNTTTGSSGLTDGLTFGANGLGGVLRMRDGGSTLGLGQADQDRININTTETVFNQDSNAYHFRIQSDNNNNMFYVNATTDRIGVGTLTPTYTFEVTGSVRASTSVSTPKLGLTVTTVSGLGTAEIGGIKFVSDGLTFTDCTVGGGSNAHLCQADGTVWKNS